MKLLGRLIRLLIGAAVGFITFQAVRRMMEPAPETPDETQVATPGPLMGGEDNMTINEGDLGGEVTPDLLELLVDPADKQPLELVDGKWLVNRRTGRRYPVVTGIPVMLPEVGDKYRDPSLITVHDGNGAA